MLTEVAAGDDRVGSRRCPRTRAGRARRCRCPRSTRTRCRAVVPAGRLAHGPPESLIDHPLLRGLLLELPPKGSVPPPGWLDRWFEATRSILELLYVQGAGRSR